MFNTRKHACVYIYKYLSLCHLISKTIKEYVQMLDVCVLYTNGECTQLMPHQYAYIQCKNGL